MSDDDDDVREVQLPFTRSKLLSVKFAIESTIDFHQSELDDLKDLQQEIEQAIAALDGKQ